MSAVERFVACARAQIGKRYVRATAGPNTFDCSGLVAYCYHDATGEAISRSSNDQAKLGLPVHVADIRPGDLVFWGRADHVGIYAGAWQGRSHVINALNEQRGVVDTMLDANYEMPFLGVRRLSMEGGGPLGPQKPGLPPGEEGASPSPSTRPTRDRDRQKRREKDRQRRGGRRGLR